MLLRTTSLLALLAALFGPQDRPVLPVDDLPESLGGAPPLGLPEEVPAPPDNPYTEERAALGRRLLRPCIIGHLSMVIYHLSLKERPSMINDH